MKNLILVLNSGSSSIKFQLLDMLNERAVITGLIENIGENAQLKYQLQQESISQSLGNLDYHHCFQSIVPILQSTLGDSQSITAIGHRVVHGGSLFAQPVLITSKVIEQIKQCSDLAPLHNPANLAGIHAAQQAFPDVPQVAVFDTAFHQSMPEHAFLYAMPYEYFQQHKVRRYGFHGISYQYLTERAAQIFEKSQDKINLIAAHLGNGCSVCAIREGKSVDTSMGLTPLEGLIMGTRSGDLDPGLFDYIQKTLGLSSKEFTQILNKQSGVLGVSGLSNDMRQIEKAMSEKNVLATLAFEMFCYRLAKYIASYMIAVHSLDALVFSGGIGENSCKVRERTLHWLRALNFQLDVEKNQHHGAESMGMITEKNSLCAMVIKTNEELMIAKATYKLLML